MSEETLITQQTNTEGGEENSETDDTQAEENQQDQGVEDNTGTDTDNDGSDGDDEDGKDEGGAPESYEDFSLPEGVELSDEVVGAISETAKAANMTQEQAQLLVDARLEGVEAVKAQSEADVQAMRDDWAEQSRNDSEIGGDKFKENLSVANKALEQFGDDDFKALLNSSGAGNHPAVLRTFHRIGKAISEDRFITGDSDQIEQSAAKKLYPNMK